MPCPTPPPLLLSSPFIFKTLVAGEASTLRARVRVCLCGAFSSVHA